MKGKTIAIVNQKGGVGKTTTTFNLGACLAAAGKKVLLVDLDQQANLTYSMGHDSPAQEKKTIAELMQLAMEDAPFNVSDYIRTKTYGKKEYKIIDDIELDYICCNVLMSAVELSLVNAMGREQILSILLEEVKEQYDYILLDCGPSLGMVFINALVASNSILIPLEAEKFASMGLELLLSNVMRVKKRLNPELQIEGVLFVKTAENEIETKESISEVNDKFGDYIYVFPYSTPRLTQVKRGMRSQTPMICYADKNLHSGESVVGKIYMNVAKEVMGNE